jgi:hypothetical protein
VDVFTVLHVPLVTEQKNDDETVRLPGLYVCVVVVVGIPSFIHR